MLISPTALQTQFTNANSVWPFITEINNRMGLLPCLLHAVGSRETNLRNVVGDGGHGHGVFQLDDRFHPIPVGFDQDVRAQAQKAAEMLVANYRRFGSWERACNAYNSGSPDVMATTGHNYGPDVMERQRYLAALTGGGLVITIPDMEYGQRSTTIAKLQDWLNTTFPAYSHIDPVSGYYGGQTTAVIKEFQARAGVSGGDGRNIGPQTKAKLWAYGFRP